MMFRDLFFPRTIKNKLLFSEKTVGISVEESFVRISHIVAKRDGLDIESFEEHRINPGEPKTYTNRLTAALKKAVPNIEKNSTIRATFPSSKVIIKELTVPFLDVDKIKMVIEFEVEASIPFPLENAVVDFIVIDQSEVKESSTILVAAAQLSEVKKFVEILQKAGLDPHSVTVDVFALTSLLRLIPDYQNTTKDYALIDIGSQSTRVAIISKGTLVAVRTIHSGGYSIGENSDLQATNTDSLFQELEFTLNSFSFLHGTSPKIEKTILLAPPSLLDSFQEACKVSLGIECDPFNPQAITKAKGVKSKAGEQASVWQTYALALGAALVDPQYTDFTLRHKEIALSTVPRVKAQVITASILAFFTLFLVGASGYFELSTL